MSNILACYQLLELHVISAQDLAPAGRSMRTYAVAWIDPDRKLSTRVDSDGGTDPSWNDKFVFRIDEEFLYDDASTITIDIYAIHWFRDILVGMAHVLADDLIPPQPSGPYHNKTKPAGMRFVGLQVHRPSGRPKGILNVGVAVIDSSMRSMPIYTHNTPAVEYHHDHHHNQPTHQAMPELRRTKSNTSSMIGSEAIVHEKRAKAKKGKSSSVVTPSEASTKSRKNATSTLSGSYVMESPKKKGYKLGKTKKNVLAESSPSHFKATPQAATPKINVCYEVKSSPRVEYQNTPKINVGYEVKSSPRVEYQNISTPMRAYNNTHKGGVRATPLHAFAITNAARAMEYGTPYRSNMGRRPIMTDSELGPSASEVAAAVARQPIVEEGENSTVGGWSVEESEEGLQPKIERWRTELQPVYDNGEKSSLPVSSKKEKHSRRHTDGGSGGGGRGGNGLFSCFSVICGVECSIVCGGDKKKNRRRRTQSVDDSSIL